MGIKKIIRKILGRKTVFEELQHNGLRVGKNFFMNTGVIIDYSHCWLIEIGDNVKIGANSIILAHDGNTKDFIGYTRIARVKIGNNVIIGAGSIIMPGVTLGNNVLVGAGSIVTKSVADELVVAGSPAKVVATIPEYINKQKSKINNENCFDESYTLRGKITIDKKNEMINKLGIYKEGFVR
jgi:maltose O-acetyltransferase